MCLLCYGFVLRQLRMLLQLLRNLSDPVLRRLRRGCEVRQRSMGSCCSPRRLLCNIVLFPGLGAGFRRTWDKGNRDLRGVLVGVRSGIVIVGGRGRRLEVLL